MYLIKYIYLDKGDKISTVPYNRPTVLKDLEFIGRTIYNETYTGKSNPAEYFYNFGAKPSFK